MKRPKKIEQRGEWTALGRTRLRCLDDIPDQNTRTQVTSDEAEQVLVPHLTPLELGSLLVSIAELEAASTSLTLEPQ